MRRPRATVRLSLGVSLLATVLLASSLTGAPTAHAASALQSAQQQERALQAKIAAERSQLIHLEQDSSTLAARIDAATRSIDQINVNQASVAASLAQATKTLTEMRSRYVDLVGQVDVLDSQLQVLGLDLLEAEGQLSSTRSDLAADIQQAYETAQTPFLMQLLSAHSFLAVLTDVSNFLQAGSLEAQLAGRIQQEAGSVQQLMQTTQATRTTAQQARLALFQEKAALQRQTDRLAASDRRLGALQAQSKAAQDAQLAMYTKLKQDRTQTRSTLGDEEAALGRLQNEIDSLSNQASIPSQYNGTLIWPMDGVVTQEFGCTGFYLEAPLGNCPHFHLGIDIAAPMDTPIRAAGDGTVLFVGPNPYDPPGERAWIVIIAHSQHLLTWYAHLDDGSHAPIVRKGEVVHQGQLIGYEGNTGISTGPHLLWMVELDRQFVNPRLFV